MPSQPNILFFMTDEQKASASSVWGNPFVRTPFQERMAAEGVVFEHAYSQSPICTPTRASIMTGTSPLVHQVYCHQNHAPPNLPQLPELLGESGYCCIGTGHYEETRSLTRGWDHRLGTDGTERLLHALRGLYRDGSREVGWSTGVQPLAPEEAHGAVLTDETLRLVAEVRPADAPLFLHVAYIEPHPPYFTPERYEAVVDYRDLPLPQRGDPDGTPPWHQLALEQYGTARATPDDIRRVVAAYYGLTAYVDDQMARLYNSLEDSGLTQDAWAIVCSDHGDYAGEKGLFTKTETPYDCLLHVPLIIRPPDGVRDEWRGRRVSDIVELTDLFSTILAMAGCEVPEYAQGFDLTRWLEQGAATPLRNATFSAVGQYHGHLKTTMPWGFVHAGRHPGTVFGARTQEFSYIRDPDYGDEAYDLRRDPLELCNLLQGERASAPDPVRDLQGQLACWEEECLALRQELGVIPGDRNFAEPLPKKIVGNHSGC